jgi:hypothetical protein
MFYAAGSTSTHAHGLKLEGPPGPNQPGNAEFEIDGPPPPPGTQCFLTVPSPARRYDVQILWSASVDGGKRTAIKAHVNLVP